MTEGGGGTPPVPAGYVPPSLPGVAVGPFSGIFRGRLVVVSGTGPNTGLFVYSGTPATGNPPIFWATNASMDPFNNAIPSTAGIAGTGQFNAGNTIINASGTFSYSGTPALGNLISSITRATGTDSSGNAYLQGATFYQTAPNPNLAVNINVGSITFFTATGPGGPWNTVNGLNLAASPAINLVQGNTNFTGPVNIPAGSGPFINGENFHTIANAAGVGGTLRVMKLPWSAIWIDLECTFSYTASSQTFTMGSLPDFSYYPLTARRFPVSVTGTPSGITAVFPRLFVPTSGAVQIIVPSGTVASGINVSGTFTYPNI